MTDHRDVYFHAADVTDRSAVNAAFAAGLEHFGAIDAAVLAAGVEGVAASFEDISEADMDEVLGVNVKGALFWMQCCPVSYTHLQ